MPAPRSLARRPAQRSAYHHGDLRAALIEAAAALVAERGTEGFSLREAAATVGVSASASYRHFASKGDLLAAVAQEGFAALAVAMEQSAAAIALGRPRRGLRAAAVIEAQALAYVRYALDHPTRFQVMFGPYGAGSERPERGVGDSGLTPYRILQASLDALVAEGELTVGARHGAELPLWCSLHGLASILINRALMNPDKIPIERTVRRVVRVAVAGLQHAPEA
jgi:AcrR family transcriptional regulator